MNGPVDVGVIPMETTEFVHVMELVTALAVAVGDPTDEIT